MLISEEGLKALLRGVIGTLSRYKFHKYGTPLTDTRKSELLVELERMMDNPDDTTDWDVVKHEYFYDDYLEWREVNGAIRPYDLVRPGLSVAQFRKEVEFHKHCIRVGEHNNRHSSDAAYGFKVCNECGVELPLSRFKKRGGAKCNACRSRLYRARVAARTTPVVAIDTDD